MRGGIGFQQGDLADRGYERVDVLFSPEVNEFRGQRTVQLNVAAMKQTGGSLLWPDEKMIFSALLQELTALASNYNTLSSGDTQAKILPLRTNQLREKLRLGRGVLMIAHQSAWAKDVLSGGEADTDVGQVRDARAFNTVLFAPDVEKLRMTGAMWCCWTAKRCRGLRPLSGRNARTRACGACRMRRMTCGSNCRR